MAPRLRVASCSVAIGSVPHSADWRLLTDITHRAAGHGIHARGFSEYLPKTSDATHEQMNVDAVASDAYRLYVWVLLPSADAAAEFEAAGFGRCSGLRGCAPRACGRSRFDFRFFFGF